MHTPLRPSTVLLHPRAVRPPPRFRSVASVARAVLLAVLASTSTLGCKKPATAASTAPEDPIVAVKTVVAVEKPMPRYLALTGSLTPNQSSDVAANTVGKILETKVERGSLVDKDALVAKVDPRTVALQAEEASALAQASDAQAKQAQEECDRADKLFAASAITGADYDKQKSACTTSLLNAKAAKARVASAYKGVGDTNIKAPFAGMVAERYVSIGEYVTVATKIARIVSIDPLRLELTVPEAAVADVKEGLAVEFHVVALPSEVFKGSIRYIGPSITKESRALLVEAVVPNPDKKLRPGMFATARIELGDQPSVAIPKAAIRKDGSINRVFVVKDGKIVERIVKLGAEKGDEVTVEDGVAKDEVVVSPVTNDVRDGARVK
jgi:membrane fusion protein (multidrug efflux system)